MPVQLPNGEQRTFPEDGDTVALRAFCEARGRGNTELALSWLAAKPEVASIIAGVTTIEQLEQNAMAADWVLSGEELDEIDRITAA